jgi:hypothetical protein
MTEARPLQTVRQLVQPALECLRRELALRSKLGSRERDLDVRERDLDLMLEISSHQSAASSDADEFGLILKTGSSAWAARSPRCGFPTRTSPCP